MTSRGVKPEVESDINKKFKRLPFGRLSSRESPITSNGILKGQEVHSSRVQGQINGTQRGLCTRRWSRRHSKCPRLHSRCAGAAAEHHVGAPGGIWAWCSRRIFNALGGIPGDPGGKPGAPGGAPGSSPGAPGVVPLHLAVRSRWH